MTKQYTTEELVEIVQTIFGIHANDRCVALKEYEEVLIERDAVVAALRGRTSEPQAKSGECWFCDGVGSLNVQKRCETPQGIGLGIVSVECPICSDL